MRQKQQALTFLFFAIASIISSASSANTRLNVSTVPVRFATYVASRASFATGAIHLKCEASLSALPPKEACHANIQVSLSAGNAGSYLPRHMTNPSADRLSYNLYVDATGSRILGDGTNATYTLTDTVNTPIGRPIRYDVYGQIPAGQNKIPAGTYSDSIQVLVNFL